MPDISMVGSTQIMTMDNNNNTEAVSSKLEQVKLSDDVSQLSGDANNNKPVVQHSELVDNNEKGDASANDLPKDNSTNSTEHLAEQEEEEDEISNGSNESHDENIDISDEQVVQQVQNTAPYESHPLERPWTMWFMNGDNKVKAHKPPIDGGLEWNQGLIELYTFESVEDFWAVYNHIQLPAKLRLKNDYMVFRKGVRPEWEDSTNRGGGMWKLILPSKMRATDLDRMWLETLLSMIGESYGQLGDLICGAYLQRRQKEDRIQLWTTSGNEEEIKAIGGILKQKLNLSKESYIHYLRHDDQTQGTHTGKNMSWSRKHKSDSLYHI